MSNPDDTEAREEWFNSFGYYPTDEDFPWPYFRDAFYAGKKSTKKEENNLLIAKTLSEYLKLEWVPQYNFVITLIENWLSQAIKPDKDINELSEEYIQGWNEYHFKFMEKLK